MKNFTPITLKLTPNDLRNLSIGAAMDSAEEDVALAFQDIGVGIDRNVSKYAMDEYVATNTAPSISSWIQFLQYFYPNVIKVLTKVRKADEVGGRNKAGDWEYEQVVFPIVERAGQPRIYRDVANSPQSKFNMNWEKRDVVRLEMGMFIGILQEKKASAMRVSANDLTRDASAEALAIAINDIFFNGFNGNTAGFLNDQNLPSYITVANNGGGTSTLWTQKTMLEKQADINTAVMELAKQSGGRVDIPSGARAKLVLPTSRSGSLGSTSDYGYSVMKWLKDTYPTIDVIYAPQLEGANGGANVFYLYGEEMGNAPVLGQYYQEMFRLVGLMRREKGFSETHSAATAGCFVGQPLGVVRYSGI